MGMLNTLVGFVLTLVNDACEWFHFIGVAELPL